MLERGRGLLWSQLRSFRTPIDQLAETNEELANRFRDAHRRLDGLATSHEVLISSSVRNYNGSLGSSVKSERKLFDEQLKMKKRLSKEQEEIINQIRQVSGFKMFLEATPFKVLQQAASEGSVIMVNQCKYRSDVLIIRLSDYLSIDFVSLDSDFYEDSIKLCNGLVETRQRFNTDSLEYDMKLAKR